MSNQMSIPRRSLTRYCSNAKKMCADLSAVVENPTVSSSLGGYKLKMIFSSKEETQLVDYLKRASDIYYGLSTTELRKLAYQFADCLQKKIPTSWKMKKIAGVDWLYGFMKRHRDLSIRQPQATSLSRATSFNPHNVNAFFDNVDKVLNRGLTTDRFHNMDESGFTTVQRPIGIIARKGRKQIGALTSAERGTLVTVALAVSSLGTSIPPFFIFPRVHFKQSFLRGAPLGSTGSANPSGWMTENDFVLFLTHFIKHVRPSTEHEVVLFLDNHSSHLSIKALDLAKANGIILITFPPHCSHKLQPLDRSVFGPFKSYFNTMATNWMREHPGETMQISNIAELVGLAYPLATTPANILSGFRVSGLSPLNRFIFNDDADFAPSFVTDRPVVCDPLNPPSNTENDEIESVTLIVEEGDPFVIDKELFNVQMDNTLNILQDLANKQIPENSQASSNNVQKENQPTENTLENLRPHPKAGQRKTTRGGGKKRRSSIITDTPEKEQLAAEKAASLAKKRPKKKILQENPETSNKAKSTTRKNIPVKKTAARKSSVQKPSLPKNNPEHNQEKQKNPAEDDILCLICQESWLESRSGEKWVQCINCKGWSHSKCVRVNYRLCDDCS